MKDEIRLARHWPPRRLHRDDGGLASQGMGGIVPIAHPYIMPAWHTRTITIAQCLAYTTAISATIDNNLKAWEWATATGRHLYITACQGLLSAITNCTTSNTQIFLHKYTLEHSHVTQRALHKVFRLIAFIIQFRTIVVGEESIIKRLMFLSTIISTAKRCS